MPATLQQIRTNAANAGMMPQMGGSFGTDPLTGAPIGDKYAAATMRQQYAAPNSLANQYLRSMPQAPLPAGGGGGGGFRMAPQDPSRRIGRRIGPRTTAEYTAENGGLSAPRDSALDAAYAAGNFTSHNKPAPAPDDSPLPTSGFYAASIAPEAGMEWNDGPGWDKPQMMAKGGTMKIGQKPYLVGEEGPELILPRENGDGFVLPADITAQVLPTMQAPTPRAEGGVIQSPSGRFAAFTGPSGSGFASRIPQSDGIDLMGSDTPPMMFDPSGRYLLDTTQPGLPMMQDTVTGPWAEPAAPVTPEMRTDLTQATAGRAQALAAAEGTVPQSRYPGQTFTDASAPRSAPVSFEDLQQTIALRAGNQSFDMRDTAERNRVQADLAARSARAPLGTPTAATVQLPGMPAMRPSAARDIARQQERFLRSPAGAVFGLQQGREDATLERRAQLAGQAIPVTDPRTGQIMGYTNGLGASLPSMTHQRRFVKTEDRNGTLYGIYDDGTSIPIAGVPASVGEQYALDTLNNKVVKLPKGITAAQLGEDFKPILPKGQPEIGGEDKAAPAGGTPPQIKTKAEWEALPAGTQYFNPNGQLLKKK